MNKTSPKTYQQHCSFAIY